MRQWFYCMRRLEPIIQPCTMKKYRPKISRDRYYHYSTDGQDDAAKTITKRKVKRECSNCEDDHKTVKESFCDAVDNRMIETVRKITDKRKNTMAGVTVRDRGHSSGDRFEDW